MVEPRKVLVVSPVTGVVDAVAAALKGREGLTLGEPCRSLAELRMRLLLDPAALILVDIDPQPGQMLTELGLLVARHAQARFVVLASDLSTPLVLRAMQVGIRHVQLIASIKEDLAAALEVLLPDGAKYVRDPGCLVTVLSAGGGCGATTLAVNVANQLWLKTSGRVLLVDFDLAYGSVASSLGLEGRYGLADVLDYGERMDLELLTSTAVQRAERFDILISPASSNFSRASPLRWEFLEHFLAICRQAYDYVVVDAPRLAPDEIERLARASGIVLLVLQLAVRDIQIARELVRLLRERSFNTDHLLLAVNRYSRGSLVKLEDLRKVLEGIALACIHNDYRSASQFLTYGKPLAEIAPRSVLNHDVAELTELVRKVHDSAQQGSILTAYAD